MPGKTEMAIVLDPNGNVVFKKTSNTPNYVRFTRYEVSRMKGNIVTHNHPRGTSLSTDDVRLAMTGELAEMRAAGKRYRYSIKPGPAGWSEDLWKRTIEREVARINQQVFSEFKPLTNSGKLSYADAELQHWHEVWTRVARTTGLIYERTEW